MKLKCIAISLATIGLLSGCAGTNMPKEDDLLKSREELSKPLIEEWKESEPAIRYYKVEDALVVEEPNRVPAFIRNKEVETVLVPDGSLLDLAVSLEELNIFVVIPEEEVRKMPIKLFAFKGKLGDYLDAIASAYNISFNWKSGNVLAIESDTNYILKVPQDESLVEEIKSSLESYGASGVHYSLQASTVSYSSSSEEHERIIDYIQKLSLNASVISLQASVVTVTLNEDKRKGFDWSSLEVIAGNPRVTSVREAYANNSSSSNTGSNFGSGSGSEGIDPNNPDALVEGDSGSDGGVTLGDLPGSNLRDVLALTGLTSGAANLALAKGDLYFSAALNFLSTYGNTETRQSVLMKTLSGKETGIKSTDAVPYVDNVGVQGSQQGFTGSSGLGRTNVKTVDVGLELTLKPYYDAQTEIVTIDLQLKLSTLLGFVELSAGNQVGNISYPRVQKQEFDDIIKLRAGEPVIVGGITFDSFSDNRSNPYFLNNFNTASQNKTVSRNAMFILLRPTVTLFGNFDQDEDIVFKE